MTNEEAIKWLNVERQLIIEIPQDNSKELKETYDMAIKALEQQPSEDCINRDDAIELIAGTDETDGNKPVFSGKQIIKMLKSLPSVTPKAESLKEK